LNDSTHKNIDLKGRSIPRYIAIEGPIGVGKTTLTKYLAETFNYETLLERAEENPFLDKFYAKERNSALPTQLFFLFQRVQQMNELRQADLFEPVRVADFLIEKDQLFAQVTLTDEELKLYQQVYEQMTINAPKPDLVIYLQAPSDTLLDRIAHRGIASEKTIDADYLHQLNEAYTRFFHFYDKSPLLIVNATEIDWVNNPKDYENLVDYMLNISSGRHYYNPKPALFG
jgi:deoxyadenosine/deoxycytidine kinase